MTNVPSKFWIFKNAILLKEPFVYDAITNNLVATMSSDVINNTISAIRERNSKEIEKKKKEAEEKKDKDRKRILDLLEKWNKTENS